MLEKSHGSYDKRVIQKDTLHEFLRNVSRTTDTKWYSAWLLLHICIHTYMTYLLCLKKVKLKRNWNWICLLFCRERKADQNEIYQNTGGKIYILQPLFIIKSKKFRTCKMIACVFFIYFTTWFTFKAPLLLLNILVFVHKIMISS